MLSSGCYTMLPLALRVLRKLEDIVDEELQAVGGNRLDMPVLMSKELWQVSGRWETMGPEMFTVCDRRDKEYCLAPTAEEAFAFIAQQHVISYKQLPLRLYQTGRKFRDETRPRGGLLRAKEFTMQDMYSFDVDEAAALESYTAVSHAYERIFSRLQLPVLRAAADTGNIGGSLSHEYHVIANAGADTLVSCSSRCGYAANIEKAVSRAPFPEPDGCSLRVSLWVGEGADGEAKRAAVVLRSCDVGNPVAVQRALGTKEAREVTASEWRVSDDPVVVFLDAAAEAKGADVTTEILSQLNAFLPAGANAMQNKGNFRLVRAGDKCVVDSCEGLLQFSRGIEVGHVFYLGTKYSAAFKAVFKTAQSDMRLMEMGCYGLGVSRLVAVLVEVSHDSKGIRWPISVAPYRVCVMPVSTEPSILAAATTVARELAALPCVKGDVVLDDRALNPGYKLKDAELVGWPVTVVFGKVFKQTGQVEVLVRAAGASETEAKLFLQPQELPGFLETLTARLLGNGV